MKNKIPLLVMLIFLSVSVAFSQEDCPPTNDWDLYTTYFIGGYHLGHPDPEPWSSVTEYYKTNPDGSIDVKVDWTTLNNWNPYGLTDNEMKGFMYMAIIKDLMINHQYPEIVNISFYELAECKIDRPCYLYANQTSAVVCKDNLWPGPDPEPLNDNGTQFWVIINKVSCGFKCCKTTYQVQGSEYPDSHGPTILSTNQSVYYDCPGTALLDCYFHNPLNCNTDCPLIQDIE